MCETVVVVFVEMIEVEVETVDPVMRVVEVDTVETCVRVNVVENTPPKGANLRIVDNARGIAVPPKLDPTIQPLVGDVM